jgi:very-short-patch-repair endonuclease
MSRIIPYNPKLKALARKLRKDMTFGEVLLWNELKDNKVLALILTGNVVLIIS